MVRSSERGAEEKRSLSDRICAFRERLGLTQEGLAELIGDVTGRTVRRWEQGHPPNYKHFERLLEIAKERGGLRQLVGTDERELMMARFQLQNPEEGALLFLDFAVDDPADLAQVVFEISGLGGTLNNFVSVGDGNEALLLVEVADFSTMETVNQHLQDSERVRDPHVAFKSRGIVNVPMGEPERFR